MLLPSERLGECACEACSKKASSQAPVEFSGVKGFMNLSGFDGNGKRVSGPVMFDPETNAVRLANNLRKLADLVEEIAADHKVATVVVGIS